jgi:hypothetical protein
VLVVRKALTELPADRPLVAVWFAVRTPSEQYVLAQEGPAGYGQRAVFEETAPRIGLTIALAPQRPDRPPVSAEELAK